MCFTFSGNGSCQKKLLTLIFVLLLVASCKNRSFNQPKSSGFSDPKRLPGVMESSSLSDAGERLWQTYLASTNPNELQTDCVPRRFPVPAGTIYKGSVFLFHGYTACPQQFFEWSEMLVKQGYEVFLPLTPGHGKKRIAQNTDDYSQFADEKNYWSKLSGFADSINAIAKEAKGTRVVAGLSLGGALATYAAFNGQDIYSRALIMTPLFQLSSAAASDLMGKIDHLAPLNLLTLNFILGNKVGWGAGCEAEMMAPKPRNGNCNFLVRHAYAAQQFGWDVSQKLGELKMPIQGVGVVGDPVVKNERFKYAMAKMAQSAVGKDTAKAMESLSSLRSGDYQMCFYANADKKIMEEKFQRPNGANHSLLSRFDAPTEDKWWLPSLFKNATDFVVNGKAFPSATGSSLSDQPLCM